MNITQLAIRRPLLVGVVLAAFFLLGGMGLRALNVNLLPSMSIPMLTVVTVYPGAGTEEVESSVTEKLEEALSTVQNLKTMNSTSQPGVSILALELNENGNADNGAIEVQRKISQISATLPRDILTPSVSTISLDELPVIKAGVFAKLSDAELYDLVDQVVKPRLSKITGVGQVTIAGGQRRQIKVNVNPKKLEYYGISIDQVLSTVRTADLDVPAGKLEQGRASFSVRFRGRVQSVDELRMLRVRTAKMPDGIELGEVADVLDGLSDAEKITRLNGNNAIAVMVSKRADGNTVKVCEGVRAEMAAIQKEYGNKGLEFHIASDSSRYAQASVDAVLEDLLLAILIVSLICYLFLHDIRGALTVMVAVPASIIPTFAVMNQMGMSLNLMSLMAMSLVVGILVDDSIVVLENIHHHREQGEAPEQASILGTKQIQFAAVAITSVIVVAFLPMAFVGGIIGNILREFALPLVIATAISLFISLAVTPMLLAKFAGKDHGEKKIGAFAKFFEMGFKKLLVFYESVLKQALAHKVALFGMVILLMVGAASLVGAGFIGSSFSPSTDQGELVMDLEFAATTSLDETRNQVVAIEERLKAFPEVENVMSAIGYTTSMTSVTAKANVAQITVSLCSKKQRAMSTDDFGSTLRTKFSNIPGLTLRINPSSITGGSSDMPVQYYLKGTDVHLVQSTAASVLEKMKLIPGVTDARISIDAPQDEYRVEVDRDKARALNIEPSSVASALRTAVNGDSTTKFRDQGKEYPIMVRLDASERKSEEDLNNLTAMSNVGSLIKVGQVARIVQGTAPSTMERKDRIHSVKVMCNVQGRSTGAVGADVSAMIQKNLSAGLSFEAAGDIQRQKESFEKLLVAILLAGALVYLILVALYNSVTTPILVAFAMPSVVIGSLVALALSRQTLNMFSIIGIVALIGLVAKDAILLVDFANQFYVKTKNATESVLAACHQRFRPILMTTVTMIFGMFPVALASGEGAEIKNGIGWVMIGGLTCSLLLTLLLVPSAQHALMSFQTWREHRSQHAH